MKFGRVQLLQFLTCPKISVLSLVKLCECAKTQDSKFETQDSKFETQDSKSETQNSKSETQNLSLLDPVLLSQ